VETLQEIVSRCLDWIKGQGAKGLEAELYVARSEERGLELRQGKLDHISQSSAEGVGLRLWAGE
jgi:predicted Zn-dependent protease